MLAVDLGGTSMRVAHTTADGSLSERREEPTAGGPAAFVALLRDVVAAGPVDGAVIGVPGRVDYRAGRLEYAPNLPDLWNEVLHEAALQEIVGVEVALANDADLAAVGESWFGAGRDHADVVYVTVSTGVGAGVVTGGLLVHGRRSLAEIGHTVIDRDAAAAGAPHTVEQLASGTALDRLAEEAGLAVTGKELVDAAHAGNEAAAAALDAVIRAAAIGAVNLAHLFTPDVLVVGGGVGLNGDLVLEPMRRMLTTHGPQRLPEPVVVVNAALGDDAALAGAGAWRRAFRPEAASR